jgi:hypothetical protein
MSTVVIDLQNVSIEEVAINEDTLTVELSDGRSLGDLSLGNLDSMMVRRWLSM